MDINPVSNIQPSPLSAGAGEHTSQPARPAAPQTNTETQHVSHPETETVTLTSINDLSEEEIVDLAQSRSLSQKTITDILGSSKSTSLKELVLKHNIQNCSEEFINELALKNSLNYPAAIRALAILHCKIDEQLLLQVIQGLNENIIKKMELHIEEPLSLEIAEILFELEKPSLPRQHFRDLFRKLPPSVAGRVASNSVPGYGFPPETVNTAKECILTKKYQGSIRHLT